MSLIECVELVFEDPVAKEYYIEGLSNYYQVRFNLTNIRDDVSFQKYVLTRPIKNIISFVVECSSAYQSATFSFLLFTETIAVGKAQTLSSIMRNFH